MGSMNRQRLSSMSMAELEQAERNRADRLEAQQNGVARNSTDPVVEPTADELDEQAEVYHDIARRYPQYADWYTDYALRLEALAAAKRREGRCVCNDEDENLCENLAVATYRSGGREYEVCATHYEQMTRRSEEQA